MPRADVSELAMQNSAKLTTRRFGQSAVKKMEDEYLFFCPISMQSCLPD